MKDIVSVRFGKNLKKLRLNKGVSQEELAEIADCHHNFIGSVERGEQQATAGKILRIAKALNCKVSDLFKGLE